MGGKWGEFAESWSVVHAFLHLSLSLSTSLFLSPFLHIFIFLSEALHAHASSQNSIADWTRRWPAVFDALLIRGFLPRRHSSIKSREFEDSEDGVKVCSGVFVLWFTDGGSGSGYSCGVSFASTVFRVRVVLSGLINFVVRLWCWLNSGSRVGELGFLFVWLDFVFVSFAGVIEFMNGIENLRERVVPRGVVGVDDRVEKRLGFAIWWFRHSLR